MLMELKRRNDARERAGSDKYAQFKSRYFDDPARFVLECIEWSEGQGPADYQLDILDCLPQFRRVTARGPHGLGKTTLESWAVLWFALTRDGRDWKVICTASAWRQLTHYLFPEVHKWSRRMRWDRIGRPPFSTAELQTLNLKLSTGAVTTVASNQHEKIEGAHGDQILYCYDESKIIPDETWDAAEGAFSTGECYALAVSTPGDVSGRFFDIHQRKPGFEDWKVRHVSLKEAIDAGRISEKWAEQRKAQWGEKSSVYQNRVEGNFAAQDEEGVIPLAWVEEANARWAEWVEQGQQGDLTAIGVDVGEFSDQTVIAPRRGNVIAPLQKRAKSDLMETAGLIKGMIQNEGIPAIIDGIGIGSGIVSRLKEQRLPVKAFIASARAEDWKGRPLTDESGEFTFTNCRSAAWWGLREMLDPAGGSELALPPDDQLTGELCAPRYKMMSNGKLQIESKADVKKRIGRSTDCADAVIQVMYAGDIAERGEFKSTSKRRYQRSKGFRRRK